MVLYSAQIKKYLPVFLFFTTLFIFVASATANLDEYFPEKCGDEYYKFHIALRGIRVVFEHEFFGDAFGRSIGFREHVLMYNAYVGWAAVYLSMAMIFVFGKILGHFFMFRFLSVFLGLLTLCSLWFVLRRWFCDWTAALTVFFVGANFSYIQSVQHGFYREEIFQVCGLWSGIALCLLGQRRKRSGWLYLGFFVFGLTLWAKIMFMAYILGAFAIFFVLVRKKRRVIKDILAQEWNVLFAGLAFVCGAAPFVLYNLLDGFPTLKLIFIRLFHFREVHVEWNNSAVLNNLFCRCHDFYLYITGEVLFDLSVCGCVYCSLFVCAFIFACVVVFGGYGGYRLKKQMRILVVFYGVVLFLTCFLPGGHSVGHILVLVPFSGILCSLFLVNMSRIKNLLFVPVLICGLWLNEQLDYMYVFSRDYIQNGQIEGLLKGEPVELVAWLRSKNIKRVFCPEPLSNMLHVMGVAEDVELHALGDERDLSLFTIDMQINLMTAQSVGFLMLNIHDYVYYKAIKNNAARNGARVTIVDQKVFKRNPKYSFLLCRVSKTDKQGASVPGLSGA